MNVLRSWNFAQLKDIVRNYGEIRFKQSENTDNDGSFITLPGSGNTEFYLKVDNDMRFRIYLPPDRQIYIDNDLYQTSINEKGYIVPAYPCFIADKDKQFVFGLDTEKMEIWEVVTPEMPCHPGAEISARNLTRLFKGAKDCWNGINNFNFTINPCDFVGIYGGSGSGKSVLMESILEPDFHQINWVKKLYLRLRKWLPTAKVRKQGKVEINGKPAWRSTEKIAYLPQHIAFPEKLKCWEILQIAMADRGLTVDWHIIEEKLELCSLDKSILPLKFGKLSGGQKRRLSLAAALLGSKTSLLIADEPTTGLDIKSELEVMSSLKKISRHGVTVIVVTHSIQSCRMFDKVIVLNKRPDGSRIVFQDQWKQENFPEHIQKKYFSAETTRLRQDDTSDAELMAQLMHDNNFNIRYAEKNNSLFSGKESKTIVPKSKAMNLLWQRIAAGGYWTLAVYKLIRRDFKSLLLFAFLALCCLIAIGIGSNSMGTKMDGTTTFITLTTITAAWLCATYSAIFTSDLLKYYAWENFSGLKPISFVTGLFTGQFLVTALISAIFASGIFFFPNTQNMVKWGICQLHPKSSDNKALCTDCSSEIVKSQKLCDVHKDNFICSKGVALLGTIADEDSLQYLNDFYEEDHKAFFNSGIVNLWSDISANMQYIPFKMLNANNAEYKMNISKRHYAAVYGIMYLVCAAGCALGIFASGLFRKAKNATLFLVVLFVEFLLFSRLFLIANGIEPCLAPLQILLEDFSVNLPSAQWGCFIPLVLSLFSMSRYITNMICLIPFTVCREFYLMEVAVFFAVFCIVPLIIAWWCVADKKKNWKDLSR